MQLTAILALEDGTVLQGRAHGAPTLRTGEVVFNTSLTGYQEVFTDPSYTGQIVILTNPQIGNYGTTPDDNEAAKPYIEGLVVRDGLRPPPTGAADETADQFLAQAGIPVISEMDTRALVRQLRIGGVMRGALSTACHSPAELVEKARNSPSMAGLDLATRVSTPDRYEWTQPVEACSPSEKLSPPPPSTASTWSPTTSASSATSSAASSPPAAASPSSPPPPPPRMCSRSSPTASSSPTAPATPSRSSPRSPKSAS